MINKFRISNFKCFSDISFEMGRLNLFAGANGCGKSSVIHALLLLQQSYEHFNSLNKLIMYGKYVNLGLANDIMYDYAESDSGKISFSLQGSREEQMDLEYFYSSGKSVLERDINLSAKPGLLP